MCQVLALKMCRVKNIIWIEQEENFDYRDTFPYLFPSQELRLVETELQNPISPVFLLIFQQHPTHVL